ncbi:MAG: hypothetical protein ACXVA4_00230, partial [Ktedonobacterales bacterium]
AVQAASAGLSRESFALDTKGLNVAANFASTDKDFTRSADLAMTDAEKHQVATPTQRGKGYR